MSTPTTTKSNIDWKHLGRVFAAARNSKNISQQTASELLNVTRASIANFERGNQKFPIERLMELSELYDLQLDLFIVEGLVCRAMGLVDVKINLPIMVAASKEELLSDAKAQGYGKDEEELLQKGFFVSPMAWGTPNPETTAIAKAS